MLVNIPSSSSKRRTRKLAALGLLLLLWAMLTLKAWVVHMPDVGNYNEVANRASSQQKKFSEDLYKQIAQHEGVRQYAYLDSEKKPTIGIGFNLSQPHNQRIIRKMGYNVKDLVDKKVRLTEPEIKRLYNESIIQAFNDARKWLPNFDEQPSEVKKAIIDMSFNLGLTNLRTFENTKAALMEKNYNVAAREMLDSKWARQVKGRALNLASMVRKYAQ
jgi:lysozyme